MTVPYIELESGDCIVLDEAKQHAYQCEWSGEWYLINIAPPHQVWMLDADDGWRCETWGPTAAVCDAKFCDWLGVWVADTVWANVVETPPAPYLAVAYGQAVAA